MMNQPTSPTPPKDNHVDYIILAQFDIDKGSTIKHQYPRPTGVDEQLLAELMLPDGAHKRDDDWTVFFLNRSETDATNANKKLKRRPTMAQPSSPATPSPVIGAFIYQFSANDEQQGWVMVHPDVMNITLNSTNISIVSKDGLHKFRIEYHEALEYTQLEPLFSCVLIDAETALGVRFINAGDEGIFLGKVESILRSGPQVADPAAATSATSTPAAPTSSTSTNTTVYTDHTSSPNRTPFLYCINFLNNHKDDTVRRGAVVRALAVCTRHNYIHVFKPFILLALQRYFAHPSEEVLADLFNSLNDMDTDKMPTLNYNQRLIVRAASDRTKQNFATSIQYIGTKMNVQLPLAVFPDEVGDNSVITLVQKFGPQVMMIFNAILSEKRVLFLGFGCSAGEVCNYVLAACCLVCPPLTGLIGRVFPYTNLCYLDFLSVPGYITGVTNPMFEEHPEWWDLLCNISTGKVTLNPLLVQDVPEKYVANDNELMAEVNYNVSSHYGEDKVKSLFQDYTQHIIDLAFDEEEFASEEERQLELDSNKVRLESWKRTTTYQNHISNRELRSKISAIRDPLVPRYIRKLRKKKSLPETEVLAMYRCFLHEIKTEDQLLEFLSYLPEANGGLYPIAVSLFHSSEPVQHATVELLNRLQGISTGSSLLSSLNPFLYRAYDRKFKQFHGTPL